MYASITFKHRHIDDPSLTNSLNSLYRTIPMDRQAQLKDDSTALVEQGLTGDDVCYAFQPTATSGAYLIRLATNRTEVIVDPLSGGGLFGACESVIRDLKTVIRQSTSSYLFGRRIPFTGDRGHLHAATDSPPVQVLQSNAYPSGINGQEASFGKNWGLAATRTTGFEQA